MTVEEDLAEALTEWNEAREGHADGADRLLITADPAGFHLRRVRVVEHDLDRDHKVYRCDKPLGTTDDLRKLPNMIRAALADIRSHNENPT